MIQPLEVSKAFLSEIRRLIAARRVSRSRLAAWRRLSPVIVLLAAGLIVLFMGTASLAPGVRHPAMVLLCIGVMALTKNPFGARHPHHVAFAFWPADEDAVFLRMFRRATASAACGCAVTGVGASVAAWNLHATPSAWLAALQGLTFAALLFVVGLVEAWAGLRWPLLRQYLRVLALSALGVMGALAIVKNDDFRNLVLGWLGSHGDLVAALAPVGWLILPWAAWVEGGPSFNAWFLLPLGLILAALPHAFADLRRGHRFRAMILFQQFGELPKEAPVELGEAVHQAHLAFQSMNAPGPTANAEAILDRSFLQPRLASPARLADRWTWRWWTPAQRLIAEIQLKAWPAGRPAHAIAGIAAIPMAWAMIWLAARSGFERGWTLGACIIAHAVVVVGIVPWKSFFTAVAIVHFLPVRFTDIVWMRWKHTVARTWFPARVLPFAGAIGGWLGDQPSWAFAVIGLQVALVPLSASPFGAVYALVNGHKLRGIIGFLAMCAVAFMALVNIAQLLVVFLPFAGLLVQAIILGLNLAVASMLGRTLHRLRIHAHCAPQHGPSW